MKRLAPFVIMALFSIQVAAQHGAGSGMPKENASEEIKQFAYAVGQWEVSIHSKGEDGEYKRGPTTYLLDAFYLPDGMTFQTMFRERNPDGFFSTQIRAYDNKNGKWIGRFVNSKRQRWSSSEAQVIDGKMTIIVDGGYSGTESFIAREINTVIDENKWVKRLYRSEDRGKTWMEQNFYMEYTRIN